MDEKNIPHAIDDDSLSAVAGGCEDCVVICDDCGRVVSMDEAHRRPTVLGGMLCPECMERFLNG